MDVLYGWFYPNKSVAAHTEVTELPPRDLGAEATQPLVDTTKV